MMIPLEPLWRLLEFLLENEIRGRLKSKSSGEIARRRAFSLYRILKEVGQETEEFAVALQSLAESIEKESSEDMITEKQENLKISAFRLVDSLYLLAIALKEANPQLEIHQFELVETIEEYSQNRLATISKAQYEILISNYLKRLGVDTSEVYSMNKKTLRQLVDLSDKNCDLIQKAIKDYRDFLAKEFPFKP